jgi:hypothetical protein
VGAALDGPQASDWENFSITSPPELSPPVPPAVTPPVEVSGPGTAIPLPPSPLDVEFEIPAALESDD